MPYLDMIVAAAKAAKVSSTLLVAICTHESGLTNTTVLDDGGSPSYGLCQVKYETAKMIGFKGKAEDLKKPKVNAKWAARYLKWQMNRYGESDWCKLAAAYNAGSYLKSKRFPGKPVNLKYVRLVQEKLEEEDQHMLSCNYENSKITQARP